MNNMDEDLESRSFTVLGIVEDDVFQMRCEEMLAEFHQRMEEAEGSRFCVC